MRNYWPCRLWEFNCLNQPCVEITAVLETGSLLNEEIGDKRKRQGMSRMSSSE